MKENEEINIDAIHDKRPGKKSVVRPYIVTDKSGVQRLVQAGNQAQALRHVATDQFNVKAASASEVIELMTAGVKPETASAEKENE